MYYLHKRSASNLSDLPVQTDIIQEGDGIKCGAERI